MKAFQKKVLESLLLIPDGKVTTYGEIAKHIKKKKASRAVGNALHTNPDPIKYPCFKVVNRKGELAINFGDKNGIETQKKRLIKSGVKVVNYKVDLSKYLYKYE